jgi:hypothetical protein
LLAETQIYLTLVFTHDPRESTLDPREYIYKHE